MAAVAEDSVQDAMRIVRTIFGHLPMEEARRWAVDSAAKEINLEATSTVAISRDRTGPPGEVRAVTAREIRTNLAEA